MKMIPVCPADTPLDSRLTTARRLGAAALAVAATVLFTAGQALAAPTVTSPGTTTANVDVGSAIALSALTPSFALTGVPGDTETDSGAVTMNVLSNNASGYTVTVEAAGANLSDTAGDNIPVTDLEVNNSISGGTAGWLPLSSTAPVQVFGQATPSANGGDTIINDYRMTIPNVPDGTYSGTLDYVASTNP